MSRLSHTQRVAAFGPPCEAHYRRRVTTPWGISVLCHEAIVSRFLSACELASERSRWVPRRIDHYVCRQIRGSDTWSLHAWPLAWDLFDRPYPEPVDVWGSANAPDAAFRSAFADEGFALGADFARRKDYPHIEWASAPPGGDDWMSDLTNTQRETLARFLDMLADPLLYADAGTKLDALRNMIDDYVLKNAEGDRAFKAISKR